jgi:hypothetical protein
MARKGPVAQKDLKVYPVDQYPFMVTKPHGKLTGAAPDRFFRTFREVREALLKDIDALEYALVKRLQDAQAAEAIAAVRYLVEQMSDSGGLINQVVDPYSGIRYQVQVTNRSKGLFE